MKLSELFSTYLAKYIPVFKTDSDDHTVLKTDDINEITVVSYMDGNEHQLNVEPLKKYMITISENSSLQLNDANSETYFEDFFDVTINDGSVFSLASSISAEISCANASLYDTSSRSFSIPGQYYMKYQSFGEFKFIDVLQYQDMSN